MREVAQHARLDSLGARGHRRNHEPSQAVRDDGTLASRHPDFSATRGTVVGADAAAQHRDTTDGQVAPHESLLRDAQEHLARMVGLA
jgi:hypothetical protein